MYKNIEIVVARYNEDLKWVTEYPFNQFKYIIYNKGINSKYKKPKNYIEFKIPNVGRCDHTYLYHIVNNYNNLENITIFLPGSVQMDRKKSIAIRLINNILSSKSAVFLGHKTDNIQKLFGNFTLDTWTASEGKNKMLNNECILQPAILRPYGKWYQFFFGKDVVKHYALCGIFSMSKFDIIKYSVNYYLNFLNSVNTHSNPEVGHYIERSWAAIFNPFISTKFVLA